MRFTYGFARFLAILLCVSLNFIAPANGDELRLRIRQGQTFFELVGQNNVFAGTNPQRSLQVGYLSRLEGIRDVFSATPAEEKTANFTFTNDVLRTQVNTIGTVSIIQRDGAFTIYLNSLPADFTVLSSFSTGVAILTGTSHQQVTVDNTAGSFSAYTDVEVTRSILRSAEPPTRLGRLATHFASTSTALLQVPPSHRPPSAAMPAEPAKTKIRANSYGNTARSGKFDL
jgi:hypothetical protein